MLSFKIFKSILKPNPKINFLRCYRSVIDNRILKQSQRFTRSIKIDKNSNFVKLAKFGLAGTIVTYVSCALWEYEAIRAHLGKRKSLFKTQFTNIFGRPPMSSDIFWVIAGVNLAIFIMFRFNTKYTHILMQFPLHANSKPLALWGSMFTHLDILHFGVNMYILHSFSPIIDYFGTQHFVAVYLTGGVFAGLSSVLYKTLTNIPRPSVGASGAILSILGMFATMHPDLRFGIPVLSDLFNFSFSAKTAIGLLLTIDTCGLIFLKSARIDHVCHISAVLFGIFYGLIGKRIFWESRKTWMSWYYSLRS